MATTLTPLATPEQYANLLQVDVDALRTDSVEQALAIASADVRHECRWDITPPTTATELVYAVRKWILLPVLHVTDCTVTVGGKDLAEGEDYWLDAGAGTIELDGCADKVTVAYTGGYEEAPMDVVGVVLDLAVSRVDNPRHVRSWGVGGESETYFAGGPVDLQADSRLGGYRLRRT